MVLVSASPRKATLRECDRASVGVLRLSGLMSRDRSQDSRRRNRFVISLSRGPTLYSKNDGLVAEADDAVLAVPEHRARQHHAFDVGAEPHQILDAVAMVYPHDVLLDDRSVVEAVR